MPERIDILTPNTSDCPAVVVNTAVNSVVIPDSIAAVPFRSSDEFFYCFRSGDNIELLSYGYYIPERFIMYEPTSGGAGVENPCLCMALYAFTDPPPPGVGVQIPLTQFGFLGNVKMPFPNYEMAMGIFIDSSQAIGEKFWIETNFPWNSGLNPNMLSMVGVPAALNGTTIHIVPFIKIMHNFPLELV
jgi:hypothetical protein